MERRVGTVQPKPSLAVGDGGFTQPHRELGGRRGPGPQEKGMCLSLSLAAQGKGKWAWLSLTRGKWVWPGPNPALQREGDMAWLPLHVVLEVWEFGMGHHINGHHVPTAKLPEL